MKPESEQTDGLPAPKRWFAASAMWLIIAISTIDGTIANIALPVIARDLGAEPVYSIWVVNSYQIAVLSTLLPLSALGERFGYYRVYLSGLALFVAASTACALSRDLSVLVVSRFFLGLGAAGMIAVNGALVRFIYPKELLGRGIGYNALVIAIGSAAGPGIAAVILRFLDWPWLFALNVPLGVAAFAVGAFTFPRQRGNSPGFDMRSTALYILALGLSSLGLVQFAHGEFGWPVVLQTGMGIIALSGLVAISRHQSTPILPVDLLRIRPLKIAYSSSFFVYAAQMMAMVSLPFILHTHFRLDTFKIGIVLTPWAIATAIGAIVAGHRTEHNPGQLEALGAAVLALGLIGFTLALGSTSLAVLSICSLTCGIGFGLFQTPNNRTSLTSGPPERSGGAAGMQALARLSGLISGTALVAMLFQLAGEESHRVIAVAAVLAAIAAGIGLLRNLQLRKA